MNDINTESTSLTYEELIQLMQPHNVSKELLSLFTFIDERLTKDVPVPIVDFDYMMYALMEYQQTYFFSMLSSNITSMSLKAIYDAYNKTISSKTLNSIKPGRQVKYSPEIKEIIKSSIDQKVALGGGELNSIHLLLAVLNGDNLAKKVLNNAGLTYPIALRKVFEAVQENIVMTQQKQTSNQQNQTINSSSHSNQQNSPIILNGPQVQKQKKKGESFVETYCINLNDLVQQGKIGKLVNRDVEMSQIVRVLGRKKKNNIVLVGDEGVGKTAIAEGLAYRIVNKDVPMFLHGKQVISLNMTSMIAGSSLRGMFESRVSELFQEIRNDGRYILLIDDIGNVLGDKQKNEIDFSSMLSKELESGDVQVIGTCNFKSYRSTFDKDHSLARRFSKIIIEAPSIQETINIINEAKTQYETYHNVIFPFDVVKSCVKLASSYITERNLPDSAIDIIDEAGAQFGTIVDDEKLVAIKNEINAISDDIELHKKQDDYKTADSLTSELKRKILDYNKEKESVKKYKSTHPVVITQDNIFDIISTKTGIPVNQLTYDDKRKLANLNERLKSEIIGQDEQIDLICKAIKRNRVGLRTSGCLYSALLIAKTGVGKTLTAKKLAKEMFGSEDSLIRFDMSEYPDKSAVNKLIGSNPGYIGYEDGGQLTEAVKNKKYCVLLLDEIEKADKEVYNIFLQVLDEGFLTDNSGQKVDFSNVIVLFTSNVGAKKAATFGEGIGFNSDVDKNSKSIMSKELKKEFPPEFLNRIDNVIYFNSLTKENLHSIIKIELNKLKSNIEELGYRYEYTDITVNKIYDVVQKEIEYGARPIKRAIQDMIEDKITDMMLEADEIEPGYVFNIENNL